MNFYIKQLSIFTNKKVIVDKTDFIFLNGEITCITGQSGCGKTLLMKAILGILPSNVYCTISQIVLKIDKKNIVFNNYEDYVKFCFQSKNIHLFNYFPQHTHFILLEDKTIYQNYIFFCKMRKQKIDKERFYHYINLINSDNLKVNTIISNLSYGLKKKIALTLSIMFNSEILLGDEIDIGVDIFSKIKILETIKNNIIENNSHFIWVSHDLHLVKVFGNKIYINQQNKFFLYNSIS